MLRCSKACGSRSFLNHVCTTHSCRLAWRYATPWPNHGPGTVAADDVAFPAAHDLGGIASLGSAPSHMSAMACSSRCPETETGPSWVLGHKCRRKDNVGWATNSIDRRHRKTAGGEPPNVGFWASGVVTGSHLIGPVRLAEGRDLPATVGRRLVPGRGSGIEAPGKEGSYPHSHRAMERN